MAITNLETSSVQLRRHTGSAGVAPSTDIMLEGEFAINLIDGHLYYGGKEGSSISSSFTFTDLLVTHSTQISGSLDIEVDDTNITGNLQIDGDISSSGHISSSGAVFDGDITVIGTGSFDVLITNFQSSSIIFSSGSTKFGDTSDDTHEFTGSVYISGSEFNIDNDFFYKPDSYSLFSSGSITASYDISASNTIYASDLDIANSVSISGDLEVRNITSSGYISSSNTIYSKNFEVAQDITASNNISASETVYVNNLEVATDISASGNISASGLLYEANTSPALLFVGGDISSSANISASGMLTINNVTATGNITASGDISSSTNIIAAGEGIFASAKVEDLTDNRVVIVGSGGELEDDTNFTFDGNELNVNASLFVENSITASNDISASNTIYTNNIEIRNDLSASNISASGHISSSGAYFDGDITVIGTGSFDVFITNYSASTIFASGSTKFGDTFDDTHIRTGSMFISGGLFVDNSITASSDISASETIYANNLEVATDVSISGDISASGFLYDAAVSTPSLYIVGDISSSANISASGHISSSLLNVGSAAVTDLTNNRVVIVGTNGELEDDTNFTFDGNELNVKKSVFVENSITASTDISASNTISASRLYASTQGTFESANVKDLTSTRIVFAGTDGELQDSTNLTFAGNEVTINGNLDVQSITSSVAISGSHISGSGMDIVGDVNILGTISASGIEGAIYYTTRSEDFEPTPVHNLSTYRVINYNTDIFITSSEGELIIQFGEPKIPTVNNLSSAEFNTNRFSGPGAGVYVIDDNYSFTFTYTLDPTNTFSSGSLLANINGVPQEIATDSTDDGSLSFNINGSTYETYLHSGSHGFTGSLEVGLADGSKQSFQTDKILLTISKNDPGVPTFNSINYTGLDEGSTYVSNNSATSNSTSKIEEGVTGTITYDSGSGTADGWTFDRIEDTTTGGPDEITINATSSPSLTMTAYYTTTLAGDSGNSTTNVSQTKNYTRIRSIRSGASPNSASFTEDEIHDITGWVSGDEIEDGNIQFNTTTITNNTTFVSITNTSVAYYYIIYDSSVADLTALRQGSTEGTNVLDTWTKSTVGNYKVYRLNLQSSPVTDNQFYLYN